VNAEHRSFVSQYQANANTGFMKSIEADAARAAGSVAAAHGEDACYLYKLGAYWGYAMMVRMALPGELSVFAVEINYYTRKADLPAHLWQPVLDRTPSRATRDALVADTATLTDAIRTT
jgi:hypothetical protein